jgi:hypothetical protein
MKEFQFKQYMEKKGFYCSVKYDDIELLDIAYYNIYYDKNDKWYNTVQFAGGYFFEKFSNFKKRGFKIKILEIQDMIIDTSHMVVFYTIIKLLTKETGYIITDLALNEDGDFLIPK